MGTHERFVAFLIEHYAGAFPTWLAPVQVRLITVSDRFNDYANGLIKQLRSDFIRAELDTSSETLNKKIRVGVTRKIPNLLVIGEREQEAGSVTLRRYGSREQTSMPAAEFHALVKAEIANRSRRV